MGFAAYRAWTTGEDSWDPNIRDLTRQGATLYTVQLGLNLAWMPLFFVLKRPIEATVDIAVLWGVVGYLTYIWGKVDRVADMRQAGVGYLNDWNTKDKEVPLPPEGKKDTKYVDEKP
ncbi:hypothetical protein FGG08_004559 [Glutinoglossum americanum]|uniref:Uncharacterized protein n=1 Tax=Glutinoglossum americanum TaxID=1670608 RepID=A0A9P8I4Z6_9PEZI|nr:hypothetical protein FGG08_004559 [Glutinoglossum americanum]